MVKVKNWFVSTFTYRFSATDVFYLLIVTVAFFSLPVFLSPDSISYIDNAYVLEGGKLAGWDSLRGPVLPFLLRASFAVFGESAYGTAVFLYLSYLVLVAATLYLFHLLGFMGRIGKGGSWFLCTALVFLNPTVLTYSHYVLTEFLALVLTVVATCLTLKTHRLLKEGKGRFWPVMLVRVLGILTLTVILYALKQMFFVFAVVPFLFSELILIAGRFSWKRLASGLAAVICVAASIPIYTAAWDAQVAKYAPVHEELSVQGLAYTTLIDGMRYFRPSERYTMDKDVRIDIMSDGYTEVLDSFIYNFDGTVGGSLKFLATCFSKSPSRFIASWKHNYYIIGNVRRPMDYSITRAYTPVTKTNYFIQSFETHAWLERFKHLERGTTGYTDEMPSGNEQFELPVDNGLVSNLLFNTAYPAACYFLYSFPAFIAGWVMLAAGAFSILRRKKEQAAFWNDLFMLSGSIFGGIFLLAITASNIDRYGFPATVWSAFLLVLLATGLIDFVKATGLPALKKLRERKKTK